MRHGDQTRVLRLIPGLENAEFYRLGRVHRNTFVNSPKLLDAFLAVKREPRVSVAGQLTGLEGYVESIATGLLAARFTADRLKGRDLAPLPLDTMLGSLLHFVSAYDGKRFSPTNANFGLLPPIADRKKKGRARNEEMTARAERALAAWLAAAPVESFPGA
jgi:methylenetetrahydrofolate--tRNA-(uracil-5-)-methyltransferase